ncbi:hypothetical protein [Natronosalvus halobius]|uniref:hypothetical protein n=1 Tax=Natronosalvus halobius TaxID=2953746 RepID=UPI00209D141A|nr:hypothetical protein [Natronosalvus halobius]USZ72694.1 hypothetical protein NGM15_05115 [Natronosalvus halobius]
MRRRTLLAGLGSAGAATGVVGASDGECESRDQDGDDSVDQNEDLPDTIGIDIENLEGECLSDGTGAYPAVRLLEGGLQVETALQTPSPCHEVVLESAAVREHGGTDTEDDERGQVDGNDDDSDGDGDRHLDRSTTELVVRLRPGEPVDETCIQCVGAVSYCLSVTFADPGARPDAFRLVHESFADPRTVLSLEWLPTSNEEDGDETKNDADSGDG